LRVVALLKAVRGLHDPALRVGEIELILGLGGFLGRLRGAPPGLLSRPLGPLGALLFLGLELRKPPLVMRWPPFFSRGSAKLSYGGENLG
jgi:hypothetical protein